MQDDPYVYSGTSILKNTLNIKDEMLSGLVASAENKITATKIAGYLMQCLAKDPAVTPKDGYNLAHLQHIHQHIFGTLYPTMAGQLRVNKISKSEPLLCNQSVVYSLPNEIQRQGEAAISQFVETNYGTLQNAGEIQAFSKNFAEVWKVHPFREGNTRAITLFASQFAMEKGMPFSAGLITKDTEDFRDSLVLAAERQDTAKLENIFTACRQSQGAEDMAAVLRDNLGGQLPELPKEQQQEESKKSWRSFFKLR